MGQEAWKKTGDGERRKEKGERRKEMGDGRTDTRDQDKEIAAIHKLTDNPFH